jgi:hypothetical protein
MVLEIKKIEKVKELSKVPSVFFGQFIHENHLFFEVFEIVTRYNGYLVLIFSPKNRNLQKPKIFKELELTFL